MRIQFERGLYSSADCIQEFTADPWVSYYRQKRGQGRASVSGLTVFKVRGPKLGVGGLPWPGVGFDI